MSLEVSVKYAETGDSQILYFGNNATVEELKRQVMEYAEHGVSCKPSSMILLRDDGTSLMKVSTLLSSFDHLTIFMFSRDTLSQTYEPKVSLEDFSSLDIIPKDYDYNTARKELCERCLGRCYVQIQAGNVALKNLLDHSESVSSSFDNFKVSNFEPYLKKAMILSEFDQYEKALGDVPLAQLRSSSGSLKSDFQRTILDVLPLDKIRKWVSDGSRQHDLLDKSFTDLQILAKSLTEQCEIVERDWIETCQRNQETASSVEKVLQNDLAPDSDDFDKNITLCIADLKTLKLQTTRSLFSNLLRSISQLQRKIQNLNDKIAALKEALDVQERLLGQIWSIQKIPEAYESGLKEADRRRQFASSFLMKVNKLANYIAKERDQELERREDFQRNIGKYLPADLIPGLSPWVFPACEITQRHIDPVLFANVLERPFKTDNKQQPDAQAAQFSFEDSIGKKKDEGLLLSPAEIEHEEEEEDVFHSLEVAAKNEILEGIKEGEALNELKLAHKREIERLRQRISELEAQLESSERTETVNEKDLEANPDNPILRSTDNRSDEKPNQPETGQKMEHCSEEQDTNFTEKTVQTTEDTNTETQYEKEKELESIEHE